MNESDNWKREEGYPLPPNPDGQEAGPSAQQQPWPGYPPAGGYPAGRSDHRRKKKFVAGLLAFMIPGLGHMYLGLMTKGIVMMLLISLDITAIVHASSGTNILSVVLLSLLLPIIYFYNLFDAIQSTDIVNDRNEAFAAAGYRPYPGWEADPRAPGMPPASAGEERAARSVPPVGILLLAGAGIAIMLLSGMPWRNWIFDSAGSMFGAVVLIGAGVAFWFWESKGNPGKRN